MTDDVKDEVAPSDDAAHESDDERAAFQAKLDAGLAEFDDKEDPRDEDEASDEADEEPDAPPSARPEYALFSARAIGWCTLFFSPLVGGLMAAINQRRLGEEQKARGTAGLAIGAVVTLTLIGYFIDSPAVNGGVAGGTGALAMGLYKEHKPLVAAHQAAGGALASPWKPVLVGVALIGLFFFALYAELHSTANAAFNAGVHAAQSEDWASAETHFREVLADDPSRDDARYNLGISLMNQGRTREARREFARVHDDSEVAADAQRIRRTLSP